MSSSKLALNLDPTGAAHLRLCRWLLPLPLPGCEAALARSLREEASFDSLPDCAALPFARLQGPLQPPAGPSPSPSPQVWASVDALAPTDLGQQTALLRKMSKF